MLVHAGRVKSLSIVTASWVEPVVMKREAALPKLNREAARLVRLTLAMHEAGSRLERQGWQEQLLTHVVGLFNKRQNEVIEQALDYLWQENPLACDALATLVESQAESLSDSTRDMVLLAIPMLVWSRYAIPSGLIQAARLEELRGLLTRHVLASGVRLVLADRLYSPDQLPKGYVETRQLLHKLVQTDIDVLAVAGEDEPASAEYVADVRYGLAAVIATKGAALFRWQESDMTQSEIQQAWRMAFRTWLAAVLPGCHVDAQLPNAFFSAWRRLEREARPFSLRATVSYLCETLAVLPVALRAVVAPCGDAAVDEYRIGFCLQSDPAQVLHGVIWPLLEDETEDSDLIQQIESELLGLGKIMVIHSLLPQEYCEDCGMPLFPNSDGELVHPEMPEHSLETPQLH